MRRKDRILRDTAEVWIDPATEDKQDDIISALGSTTIGAPSATTKYAVSAIQGSHTVGGGISHMYVQNTGGVLIRIGASDCAATTGIVWTPYQGFFFSNVTPGALYYFIRDTTAAVDGEISFTEFT